MNFINPFPMHGYHMKTAGAGIALPGLLLIIWLTISGQALTWMEFNLDEQLKFGFWIFTLGLYLMAFSKEKVDDERVQRIRQVALRSSFQILLATLLALNIAGLLGKFEVVNSLHLITFTLVYYHIIYYIALIRNPDWAYQDVTVTENFRMNRKFYLIYALVLVVLFAAIALVNYFKN